MTLGQVRRHAMSLPGVTEAPHHHFSSFRVQGKIFVTVPPEETHIHVFVDGDDRERALAVHLDAVDKLLWGGKVVGVRVALATAQPAAVRALVEQAWLRKAPLTLRAQRDTGR